MKSILGGVVLFSICLLLVGASGLHAQINFTFDLDVSCQDTELRSLVRSYFSRELRELGDARLAGTSTPDYQVSVIALKEGRNWTMSVVVTAPFVGDSVEGSDAKVAAALGGYAQPIEHSLSRGDSYNDLNEQIAAIVRDLNTKVLKPKRKELKKK